jgi:hypothetical protein
MPRIVQLTLATGLCLVASLAVAAGAGAKPKLSADYHFDHNFMSSGDDARSSLRQEPEERSGTR